MVKKGMFKLGIGICMIFSMIFNILPIDAYAKSSELSEYYYVYNDSSILSRENIDEIDNYATSLDSSGVDIILNVKEHNPYSENKESGDIFDKYAKKANGKKKIIVVSYYTDSKEFYIWDDYKIFSEKDLISMQNDMIKFQNAGKVQEGIMYTYKIIAKKVNSKLSLNLSSIEDLETPNPFSNYSIMLRNAFGLITIIIVLICFRRNKKNPLE